MIKLAMTNALNENLAGLRVICSMRSPLEAFGRDHQNGTEGSPPFSGLTLCG